MKVTEIEHFKERLTGLESQMDTKTPNEHKAKKQRWSEMEYHFNRNKNRILDEVP